MQASVKWMENFKFIGESQSGHSIVLDGSGGSTAPSPMEMVLMAAGGCSSVDVIAGLKDANQTVINCEAKLTTERRDVAPKLFTKINIHFIVEGSNLDESIVAKVTKESLEKYCSVCLMLGEGVTMSHSYEVISA